MAQQASTVQLIGHFFQDVYGTEGLPGLNIEPGKTTKYSYANPDGPKGISVSADPYKGLHIDIDNMDSDHGHVTSAINNLITRLERIVDFDSLWVNLKLPLTGPAPLPPSWYTTAENGISKDLQDKKVRHWTWLNPKKPCTIPEGATHEIAGQGLVYDPTTEKVLLVVNKAPGSRASRWNLPGGRFDIKRDTTLLDAARNEIHEELGIKVPDESAQMVGFLTFQNNPIAKSMSQIWGFNIPGISKEPLKKQKSEIKHFAWISAADILNRKETIEGYELSPEVYGPLVATIHNLGLKQVSGNKKMEVYAAVAPAQQQAPQGKSEAKEEAASAVAK